MVLRTCETHCVSAILDETRKLYDEPLASHYTILKQDNLSFAFPRAWPASHGRRAMQQDPHDLQICAQ